MNPMSQDENRQKTLLLRSLKGAPVSIILALVMFGRLTGKEMAQKTGYHPDTITKATDLLQSYGMIYQVDQHRGWKLSSGIRQLSLALTALLGSESGGVVEGERRSEILRSSSLLSSSSLTTHSLDQKEAERSHPDDRKFSDHLSRPVDNPPPPVDNSANAGAGHDQGQVAALLTEAGVGHNSVKLLEIIAQNHDPEYIRAHVQYFHWWQEERRRDRRAERIDGRAAFTVGTLITRILANDPAPPLRCDGCGLIDGCVCHIIQR